MVHQAALTYLAAGGVVAGALCAVAILLWGEASVPRLLRSLFAAHRSAGNLPDALQWLDFTEHDGFDLVLQRNGNLVAIAEILSCDNALASDDDLYAIADRLHGIHQNLPVGFALSHHIIRRRPAPLVLKTPKDAPRVIHYLRRRQQEFWGSRRHLGYDNRHYLILEGVTGGVKEGFWTTLLHSKPPVDEAAFATGTARFCHTWRAVLDSVAGFARVRPLQKDSMLRLFDYFLNPLQPERRGQLRYNPAYTIPEQVCGAHFDNGGADLCRADNGAAGPSTLFRVLTLGTLPAASWPTCFASLARLGSEREGQETSEYWISQHYEIQDPEQFTFLLGMKVNWGKSMSSVKALANIAQKSVDLAHDASEVINAIQRDKEGVGYFSMFCVVYDRDKNRMERTTHLLMQEARSLNAQFVVELPFARFGSWLASLPGHSGLNCRRLFNFRRATIVHANAAEFALLHRDHDGDPDGPVIFETPEGGTFRWSPFTRFSTSWNGVVMGTTGAGKSFLMNHVVTNAQAMTPRPLIYIMDVGNSYDPQIQLVPGSVKLTVDFENPDLELNPFEFPSAPAQGDIVTLSHLMEHLVTGGQAQLTQSNRVDAIKALNRTFEGYDPERPPVLLDFYQNLKAIDPTLAKPLELWIPGGPYAAFFNHPRDKFTSADLVYFELSRFDDHPDVASALVYLIFSKIFQRLQDRAYEGRQKLIILDETWKFLMNDVMAGKIKELYRTIRKHGGATWTITQHPNDLIESKHRDAILANTSTVFFLEQKNLGESTREAFHLNPTEFKVLRDLHMHKGQYSDLFIRCDAYKRVVRVRIDPYSTIAYTTDAEQKHERAALVDSYGETMTKQDALQQAIEDMAEGKTLHSRGEIHVA